jgi:glycosyltransferase involved in cell wall biosynthesis
LNVLIVNHYALAPGGRSSSRHASLGRTLIARGHRVEIVAASFDHFARAQRPRPRGAGPIWSEEIDGLHFRWVSTPGYARNNHRRVANILVFFLRLLRLPQFPAAARPDLVIGSSFHPLAAFIAWLWARRLRVPFVFEVRDLWPQTGIDLGFIGPRNPVAIILYAIEGFLARRAARILVLLPGGVEYFGRRYGEAVRARTVWLPNGADVARFRDLPQASSVDAGLHVMYLGAHGRPNELDQVLDAFVELGRRGRTDIRITLVGDGTERTRLQRRAISEGLMSVSFLPAVDKSRIPELAASADAFVIVWADSALYRYGVSANKLFEYLAAGRPIVQAYGGHADPVAAAEAGITVPPNLPSRLADALEQVAAMTPGERVAMGARGRQWVEANHDYPVLAAKLESVLSGIVEPGA